MKCPCCGHEFCDEAIVKCVDYAPILWIRCCKCGKAYQKVEERTCVQQKE